ncbi:hypothetical protein Tco_0988192 [Tanacetum coccineum]|uniref:Uncharacterized protein n=1 Tax=Tanacetum coccineum TaxID=301880 RepID=A0ABQ5EQP0_9ASTR
MEYVAPFRSHDKLQILKQFANPWLVPFASAVPGQMTHLVAISTLDSANSCVMQGASCTQREVFHGISW